MASLGGGRSTDHVGRGANGGGAAANVGTQSQSPSQDGQSHALFHCQRLDDGDHGGSEGDVVDEGTGNGRHPQDDGDHQHDVAAADLANELGDELQDARLLQTTNHDEQTYEEKQSFVVHLFEQVDGVLAGGDEGEQGDKDADGGHGQASFRMGDQQDDGAQEDNGADDEGSLVGDGFLGCGHCGDLFRGSVRILQLTAEGEVEEDEHKDERDASQQTGVVQEIEEGIPQRGADDDIWGVTAHGGGTAQVGTEYFGQDHGDRVKM